MQRAKWVVLSRDISASVRVEGELGLWACMVLDVDSGLILGVVAGPAEDDAVTEAIEMALAKPTGNLSSGRPQEILCAIELKALIIKILPSLITDGRLPLVRVVEPMTEAEDIFDSFVGHMSGRSQPTDVPSPSDWDRLYRCAFDFYQAAPWTRWHDMTVLSLNISMGGGSHSDWAAVVMGNSGIQYGLALYPGGQIPASVEDWEPGLGIPMPPGMLSLILEPTSQLPSDVVNKAFRYGWPPDEELVPAVLVLGEEGGSDPGAVDTQVLAVALTAVQSHDARGPIAVGSSDQVTNGEIILGNGHTARFSIAQKPPALSPQGPRLLVHQAGFDLVPQSTPFVLGHMEWDNVVALRREARLHQPIPSGTPRPASTDVPLIVILPQPDMGDSIASKIAKLDPYGIIISRTDEGQEIFVLVGGNGAEVLMEVPADNASMSAFRRRMRETKGLHVLMVADQASSRGEGTVYGLFECNQPLADGPQSKAKPRSQKPSKGSKKS